MVQLVLYSLPTTFLGRPGYVRGSQRVVLEVLIDGRKERWQMRSGMRKGIQAGPSVAVWADVLMWSQSVSDLSIRRAALQPNYKLRCAFRRMAHHLSSCSLSKSFTLLGSWFSRVSIANFIHGRPTTSALMSQICSQ